MRLSFFDTEVEAKGLIDEILKEARSWNSPSLPVFERMRVECIDVYQTTIEKLSEAVYQFSVKCPLWVLVVAFVAGVVYLVSEYK